MRCKTYRFFIIAIVFALFHAPRFYADANKFILMTMLYNEKKKARKREYMTCLQRNLANPAIERVHIFYDTSCERSNSSFARDLASLPITITPIKGRATFGDLFSYAAQEYNNRLIIICNADIFFDETLNLLTTIDFSNLFIALTRWDMHQDGSTSPRGALWNTATNRWEHKGNTPSGSQDAWIFQAPLPPFNNDHIKMGTLWCDPCIAYQAYAVGLQVINPCLSIKAYHLHLSAIRHDQGPTNPTQPYLLLPFTKLPTCSQNKGTM